MVYVEVIGYEYILGYGYDVLKKEMKDIQHIFFASHAQIIASLLPKTMRPGGGYAFPGA